MTWVLLGYSTEEHGENAVRYRKYTTSERTAKLFDEIPRIEFTDSGHGIVFAAANHTGARKPVRLGCANHVDAHMKRLRVEAKKQKAVSA